MAALTALAVLDLYVAWLFTQSLRVVKALPSDVEPRTAWVTLVATATVLAVAILLTWRLGKRLGARIAKPS
jgi:hypothetical protein